MTPELFELIWIYQQLKKQMDDYVERNFSGIEEKREGGNDAGTFKS